MRFRDALFAEFFGTAFILLAMVGSGIAAANLAGGNQALLLLANSAATGLAYVAVTLAFEPVSGAHFNPAYSALMCYHGELPWRRYLPYVLVQCLGALLGVMLAQAVFGLPLLQIAERPRAGFGMVFGEFVATVGLLVINYRIMRTHSTMGIAFVAGAYVAAARWFTPSTSLANPAVTLSRMFTDTFSGIRPQDVPAFLLAQVLATVLVIGGFYLIKRVSVLGD